uniref:Uncharacterized protein n=1 Tax=Anopheles maculatus TaxID=74869 RepID=A0A182SBN1_9DIPT
MGRTLIGHSLFVSVHVHYDEGDEETAATEDMASTIPRPNNGTIKSTLADVTSDSMLEDITDDEADAEEVDDDDEGDDQDLEGTSDDDEPEVKVSVMNEENVRCTDGESVCESECVNPCEGMSSVGASVTRESKVDKRMDESHPESNHIVRHYADSGEDAVDRSEGK